MRTLVAAAVACSILVSLSQAQSSEASIRKTVNIGAQGLSSALKEFARERELYLIFDDGDVVNHRTQGVAGEMTQDEVLGTLLKGSGLTYRYLDEKTVMVVPVATGPAVKASGKNESKETRKSGGFWSSFRVAEAEASSVGVKEEEKSPELAEIVVTAQKREERLQDVPISIGVLSGADLDRGSSRGVTDVLNQIGGVSVTEVQPGAVTIAVRGVLSGTGTSTTGYYQDEVPFAFITTSGVPDTNAFDLERIEVLRGPQGTLYGANALSGVVRVLTNNVNLNAFEAKGRARASSTDNGGGNYGADLALNVPLVPEKLGIRAVASYSDLSGFIDSVPDRAPFNGARRINDTEAQAYRLKVSYKPVDNLRMDLGFSRSQIDNGAPTVGTRELITVYSENQPDKRVLDTLNLSTEYKWSRFSLLSSTSYLDYSGDTTVELLFPAIRFSFLNADELKSFSQEIRLISERTGAWQWSAGAFYKDTKQRLLQDARPLFPGVSRWLQKSESYALFSEVTRYLVNDTVEITGGARYFEDRVGRTDISYFSGNPNVAAPVHVDFNRVTGRLALAYKPQVSRTYYASVATGFRSGIARDTGIAQLGDDFPALKPDSLITYELGTKGGLSDGALQYDVAVYYMDWKDIQQNLQLPNLLLARVNAGKASGAGVDAAISYQPRQSLTLSASVGWNDLRMDEDVFSRGVVLFEKGARINNSPEWTGSVGAVYKTVTPLNGVRLVLSGNFAYGSERLLRFLSGPQLAETVSDDMPVLKASAGLEGQRWSLDLYGDNILNEDGSVSPPDAGVLAAAGILSSIRQRPRTVGLQVTFSF